MEKHLTSVTILFVVLWALFAMFGQHISPFKWGLRHAQPEEHLVKPEMLDTASSTQTNEEHSSMKEKIGEVLPPPPSLSQSAVLRPSGRAVVSPIERDSSDIVITMGQQGDGWGSNSWNVLLSTSSDRGATVSYQAPWGGFSHFSPKGMNLTSYASIEIILGSSTALTAVKELRIAMLNGKEELGTIPLSPYQVVGLSPLTFRVPLNDFKDGTVRVTDMYVMSAIPQRIDFSKIAFSHAVVVSQRSLWDHSASGGNVSAPLLTPPLDTYFSPDIYHSGLRNGWSVEGKRGLVIVDGGDENWSVTGKALKIKFTEKDGVFVLSHPKGVSTKGMKYLYMKIYGGTLDYGWQQLNITFRNRSGEWLGSNPNIMEFSANGVLRSRVWNEITLPLSAFNPTSADIGSIEIGNLNTTQEGDHLWVDDIHFLEN